MQVVASTFNHLLAAKDRALDRLDAIVWSRGLRRPPHRELRRQGSSDGPPPPYIRSSTQFDYDRVATSFQHPIEVEGRLYNYVFYPGSGDTLCVHFSAFFDEVGERRKFREFRGYFHRLRMFWPLVAHSFLFLVDTFGAEENGCYYKGIRGDFFVERATDRIIQSVVDAHRLTPDRVVTLGSSMGGTAALRFGLRRGFAGVVAVCPHIDLDTSALTQGRVPHVAAILGDEDVGAERHLRVTREIRLLATQAATPLPRLAIQSMVDDHGVHNEQVIPLVNLWRTRGGEVTTDYHLSGGHTSDYATADYFKRSIDWCLS